MKHVFAMALAALVAFLAVGQASGGGTKQRKPLDLPVGNPSVEEEDEEIVETVRFYGAEFEGDAFVWCFHAYDL